MYKSSKFLILIVSITIYVYSYIYSFSHFCRSMRRFGEYDELDCTKYNGFADYCGDYADNAEEMCCACGGGKIIQPGKR